MEDNIKQLKNDYKKKKKKATSKEEKQQIKHDYKEIKQKVQEAEKMIKRDNLLESSDEFWSKFDFPNFPSYDDYKEMDKKIEESDNKRIKILSNNTKIDLIVSDIIPDAIYNIINELEIISFDLGEIEFFSKKEIDAAQKGFRFNPITNETINEWIGNNYIIIGYDCTAGCGPNPIIMKIDNMNYPVYWMMTDGDWKNPIKIADSLLTFSTAYKILLKYKSKIESNSLIETEKNYLIHEIEKIVSFSNVNWWKNIIING